MTMPVETFGLEFTPEQIQAELARQGFTSDQIQAVLAQQGTPLYSQGKFVGYETGERPVETYGLEMMPEQIEAQLQAQRRADLGIPEARLRYFGEQQTIARQELGAWEKNLKNTNPELFEVYRKGGRTPEARAEAYNKEIANRQAAFEGSHTRLPDDSWILNSDLEAIKKESPESYELLTTKGYATYEAEYNKALDSLKAKRTIDPLTGKPASYMDDQGNVDLARAVANMSPEERDRLALLFNKSDIDASVKATTPLTQALSETSEAYKRWKEGKASFADMWTLAYGDKLQVAGAPYAGAEVERGFAKVREKIKDSLSGLPTAIRVPTEFATRMVGGAMVAAPWYTGQMILAVAGIPTAENKVGYVKDIGSGMANYFKSVPGMVKKDPAMAGELVGVFILGPEGALKLAKGVATKGSPWYIPNQGMRFSFTTGKLATKTGEIDALIRAGRITETDIARAIARAQDRALTSPAAVASARIGKSNVFLHIEPTPVSKQFGGILWHAAPERAPFKGKAFEVKAGGAEPAMFTSIHAAPRFAIQSAHGPAATAPALVMIYTKKSGLRWYPSVVQDARSIATMESKGFEYLGSGKAKPGAYGPIKTYATRFENEALLPNGMKLYRVTNLRSRVMGASAGEFVTTADGWVMPIYRFAEKGAKVPKVGLAELTAIRIDSVAHGLRLLLKSEKGKGKVGFGAESGRAEVGTLAKQLEAIGKTAMRGKTGKAADTAYYNAIDKAMVTRLDGMLRQYPQATKAYKANPEAYETAYRERLNSDMARYYGTSPRAAYREAPYVDLRRDTRLERRLVEDRIQRQGRELPRRGPVPRTQSYRVTERARYVEPPRRVPATRGTAKRTPPPEGIPRTERTPPPPRTPPPATPPPRTPPPRTPPPRTPPPETPPPPRTPPRRDAPDKEKREYIRKSEGAITFRLGELHDKDVWHVIVEPYQDRENYLTVIGDRPRGTHLIRGPGSAYKTAQMVYGPKLTRSVSLDIGVTDVLLEPMPGKQGVAISFRGDPHLSTTSDINISKRVGPITKRSNIRITPKFQRLS
jgi:hypothetical protein